MFSGDATTAAATGVQLRKRPRVMTPEQPGESEMLRAIHEELRSLREERQQQQAREAEFQAQLHQRDEALQRLEERLIQLSPPDNIPPNVASLSVEGTRLDLGFKLKPDTYDGSVPLREFMTQFEFIARSNSWSDLAKTVALVSCLRGKARTVLDGVAEIETASFAEVKARLELLFGEGFRLSRIIYSLLIENKNSVKNTRLWVMRSNGWRD